MEEHPGLFRSTMYDVSMFQRAEGVDEGSYHKLK